MISAYYQQILSIFGEKPDLSSIGENDYIPQRWPLLLKRIIKKTGKALTFEVEDLNTILLCKTNNTDLIYKISTMQTGQIIFLYDAIARLNPRKEILEVIVTSLYTLKEVNDGLAKNAEPVSVQEKKIIKVTTVPQKRDRRPSAIKVNHKDYGSRWRVLSERWEVQGKMDDQ